MHTHFPPWVPLEGSPGPERGAPGPLVGFALQSPSGAVLEEVVTVSGRYVPLVPTEVSRLAYRVAPTVVTRTPPRVAFGVQR